MRKNINDPGHTQEHAANQSVHRESNFLEQESNHKPDHPHRHRHDHENDAGELGHRNFWHEWRDERHHHGHDMDIHIGQALSPKEMEAWREFFHTTFGTWPEEHWIFGGRRFSPWHQGIESFNPFVANLLSKGGGLLPLYILHLVSQKPHYGNEIMELLAECTNGQWVSNPGAIYPLLTLLEHEGFVTGEWEDPDKRTIRVYTITSSGIDEVRRIKSIVLPKIEETIQVLQVLFQDLQNQTAATARVAETGKQANNKVEQ
jgi:DNA-binding PadR family transcriptional regulator